MGKRGDDTHEVALGVLKPSQKLGQNFPEETGTVRTKAMLTHLHKAGEPWQGWATPRALPQIGGTGRPLFVSIYQGLEAKWEETRKL